MFDKLYNLVSRKVEEIVFSDTCHHFWLFPCISFISWSFETFLWFNYLAAVLDNSELGRRIRYRTWSVIKGKLDVKSINYFNRYVYIIFEDIFTKVGEFYNRMFISNLCIQYYPLYLLLTPKVSCISDQWEMESFGSISRFS